MDVLEERRYNDLSTFNAYLEGVKKTSVKDSFSIINKWLEVIKEGYWKYTGLNPTDRENQDEAYETDDGLVFGLIPCPTWDLMVRKGNFIFRELIDDFKMGFNKTIKREGTIGEEYLVNARLLALIPELKVVYLEKQCEFWDWTMDQLIDLVPSTQWEIVGEFYNNVNETFSLLEEIIRKDIREDYVYMDSLKKELMLLEYQRYIEDVVRHGKWNIFEGVDFFSGNNQLPNDFSKVNNEIAKDMISSLSSRVNSIIRECEDYDNIMLYSNLKKIKLNALVPSLRVEFLELVNERFSQSTNELFGECYKPFFEILDRIISKII